MPSSSPFSQKKYVKLGGRSRGRGLAGRFQVVRLWKTDDHLLLQEYGYVMEVYKRFYFSDLKAIHIRQTRQREIRSGIIAGLGVLISVVFEIAMITSSSTPSFKDAGIIFGMVAGPFLLIAAIVYTLGPTCDCMFETAVQKELIPSLNRLRKVRKVLPVIHEAVMQVQQPQTGEQGRSQGGFQVTGDAGAGSTRPWESASSFSSSPDLRKQSDSNS